MGSLRLMSGRTSPNVATAMGFDSLQRSLGRRQIIVFCSAFALARAIMGHQPFISLCPWYRKFAIYPKKKDPMPNQELGGYYLQPG